MHVTENTSTLREAVRVYTIAMCVIALRGLADALQQRHAAPIAFSLVRSLIRIKESEAGLTAGNFDARLEGAKAVIVAAESAFEALALPIKSTVQDFTRAQFVEILQRNGLTVDDQNFVSDESIGFRSWTGLGTHGERVVNAIRLRNAFARAKSEGAT